MESILLVLGCWIMFGGAIWLFYMILTGGEE